VGALRSLDCFASLAMTILYESRALQQDQSNNAVTCHARFLRASSK
jgi:hypothetical protein